VNVLHRPGKLGLGTAYVEGFQWGLARGYGWFFEMDADLSHDPKHLDAFLRTFERGADVVVGSRKSVGGRVEGWGPLRHTLSQGGTIYAKTILGVQVTDLTTGFKGYTRRALLALNLEDIKSNGYSFQVETTFRAIQAGLDVREVPIVFVDRRVGQSKMSKKIFLEAVFMVVKLRLAKSLGAL
jgi:dolichol-phosphate mannosyltransferase